MEGDQFIILKYGKDPEDSTIQKYLDPQLAQMVENGQLRKTYVDIIKNIKKEVDIEELVVEKINKTKNEEVEVRIKGTEENAKLQFRQLLTTKMKAYAEVGIRKRNQPVIILDIDETTQEGVKDVIQRELEKGKNWK
ncbi:unnamed protein product [Psylliodes chrysocephalus]|uniref:Uncharacterized protein n=1 Tax=Psylliodes chrysocephalus TaxID=3402493 RepID=A0A9P0GBF5_9CUCU|nr:unnamed protein product [Psylliodes chrysocephala]